MAKPHVLAVAGSAQGHVIPLMEVAICLAKHGIKVTFANAKFVHERVVDSMSQEESVQEFMEMVAIPDGLKPSDRSDHEKLFTSMSEVMPNGVEALIERINGSEGEKVTCVLADAAMAWAVSLAKKFGLKSAVLWPAATAGLAVVDSVPSLIADGIIDTDGKLMKDQMVTILPNLSPMKTTHFPWYGVGNASTEKLLFDIMVKGNELLKLADRLICNSCYDLESETLSSLPNIKPIGPLLASNRLGKTVGHFWPEDSSCVEWLDQQAENSVIYVAFGSFTVFDPIQFQELALGLELSKKPFLWVARQDITSDMGKAYPDGFKERVGDRGLIVNWAPQQKVLSHPSIACFISHCGWNSTIESIANGVPLLCWPYFTDQFFNQSYISDHWKVGLKLDKDQKGMVSQSEIKKKIHHLLDDPMFKERVEDLQEKLITGVKKGGSSYENFTDFIGWIKW